MKKILFLAAVTLTLAACNNDDNYYIDQPVAAQISATIGKSAVSRASETTWAKGDEIGITMTGNNISYVNMKYTTGGDGIFTGAPMYFKNHIDPLNLTAYYPYKGDEGTSPILMGASTSADNQTSDKQPEFDFLYASLENITGSEPNVNFTFAHKMSKITFIFEKGNDGTDVSKITSYQIDGLILEGTFNPATGVCATKDVGPASLSMTTTGVENGKLLPSLIIFPQATAGKTVTLKIKDNENQDYACTLNFGDDGIVAGNNYQYTIKVSKTGLSVVNSDITNWVENQLGSEAISDDED